MIGWPSLARGTFGGEVVLVDPTDNGKGKFRILVAEKQDVVQGPDGQATSVPWPSARWLRQGFELTAGSCCNGFRCGTRFGAN